MIFVVYLFQCYFHFAKSIYRSSHPGAFCKNIVLKNIGKFTGKYQCKSIFFNKITGACNFIKKDTLVQLFSCEFKNLRFFKFLTTLFYKTPPVVASVDITIADSLDLISHEYLLFKNILISFFLCYHITSQ